MKTQKQIDKEIAELKRIRPLIPEENYFGESNVDQIDAQIRVLELGMTSRAIDERWESGHGAPEEAIEESFRMGEAAKEAHEWRNFDGKPPHKDWLPLCKKKK